MAVPWKDWLAGALDVISSASALAASEKRRLRWQAMEISFKVVGELGDVTEEECVLEQVEGIKSEFEQVTGKEFGSTAEAFDHVKPKLSPHIARRVAKAVKGRNRAAHPIAYDKELIADLQCDLEFMVKSQSNAKPIELDAEFSGQECVFRPETNRKAIEWGPAASYRCTCKRGSSLAIFQDVAQVGTNRHIEPGEVLDLLQGPFPSPDSKWLRAKCRAVNDGLEGWVTLATQSKALFEHVLS